MTNKIVLLLFCVYLVNYVNCSYSSTTPTDLKARARLALQLEKPNVFSCEINELEKQKQQLPCPPSKFRSPTGECNNIIHRNWGSRGDVFLRLMSPNYADGKSKPRTSVGSHALPEPQTIVHTLQKTINSELPHPHITAMLPAWGQLLSYDLIQITTPFSKIRCCRNGATAASTSGDISSTEEIDQCYVRGSAEQCKEYKRSVPSHEIGNCTFTYRNQMNVASGFIDGSGLYGSTEKDFQALRTYRNGKVDIKACPRCNEIGSIGALHTILLKEHNRIADVLSKQNPSLTDTTLFLESRRAVTAQIQHITYNEFLPIILGQQISNKDSLRMVFGKHYDGYSSSIRSGMFNEIAVGAFPAFLSMLPAGMMNDSVSAEILISTPALQKTYVPQDPEYHENWTPIELAIQRGRDHGISSYHEAVNVCESRFGREQLRNGKLSFESIEQISGLNGEARAILEKIYMNVEDIDLLTGALLEKPAPGTVFGPTLSCMLAVQFANLRNSDRFWYENDIPPSSLSLEQLQAVRRVSLAGLLCESDDISKSQPKAFIREDPYLNFHQNCNQIPGLDLSSWKNTVELHTNKDSLQSQTTSSELNDGGLSGAGSSTDAPTEVLDELSPDLLQAAFQRAKENLNERKRFEYEAWVSQGGGIDARSPDGTAASFSKANRNAIQLANSSLFFELTSNEILNTLHGIHRRKRQAFDNNNLGVFRDDFANSLQNIDVNSLLTGSISPVTLEPQCEDFSTPCDPTTPFRTLTGHCNNLANPEYGKSLTTFARLLPPVYEDGISRPRVSSVVPGVGLPNPRTVSALIHPDISNLHTRYALIVMQYAQFLDHDLTMTPIHKGFQESIPKCRPCDSPRTIHPECNPIPIPAGDHYYPQYNVTSGENLCFPFMRSLPGQQSLGPREQINQNTGFLDASQIYGENNCICTKLRGFSGRLNSTIHPIRGKELLPQSPLHPECKSPSGYCFIAGDGRASEQPGLTAIHTTFLREHNRIVEGLRGVNPHWDGETLFNHARRIVIAENQHLTYNEFLPRILSWNAVNLYGLKLLPQGYYSEYDSSCNPGVVTEFAAAAFRIGHSLLRPHIPRIGINHQPIDPPLLLRDGFFKVDNLLAPSILDEINRGLVATPMETLDQFITGEVTNHLFEDRRIPFSGIDLVSLNVQRARDHGIPSYNNYRALCNLKRARTWEDLSREIPPEVISRFKRIYASVDDIDLFPGGMSERPLQGGLVGPTFACIIGIQFRQARKCDRFWYETNDPNLRFTEAQLNEIRKTTLSKIICENLDVPGEMQRAAFDLPSNFLNPRVPCHSMPQIDLSAWRENIVQGCQIGGRHIAIGESAFPSPCTSCICTNEGAQCASLRITDCAQLAREWSRESILADDVCSAQCGLVLQRGNNNNNGIPGLSPPPARSTRSRAFNTFSFNDFSFPDLTQFIG